jgi:hypothetical protein
MYLFLIIVLPSALVYYSINVRDKAVIPVVITGMLSSALFCALKAFFSFMYRIPSAAFFPNYLYILFGQTLFPCAVVYLLFFFLSKDEESFRIQSYFPLLCSFFTVYLPFHILAGSSSAYSFFELFLKPVLYLMMLSASAICVRYVFRAFGSGSTRVRAVWISTLCASLFLPAAAETLWFTGRPVWTWLVLYAAYVLCAVCGYIHAGNDDMLMKTPGLFLPDINKLKKILKH